MSYKSVRPTRLFIAVAIYGECVAAGRDEPAKSQRLSTTTTSAAVADSQRNSVVSIIISF